MAIYEVQNIEIRRAKDNALLFTSTKEKSSFFGSSSKVALITVDNAKPHVPLNQLTNTELVKIKGVSSSKEMLSFDGKVVSIQITSATSIDIVIVIKE